MSSPYAIDLVVDNTDLDLHPAPAPSWRSVGVIGLWRDAKVIRKRWPHAAIVGPLRTRRGLDLLVRTLLANPQLRVLVIDGPDLTPGGQTLKDLWALWGESVEGVKLDGFVLDHIGEDLRESCGDDYLKGALEAVCPVMMHRFTDEERDQAVLALVAQAEAAPYPRKLKRVRVKPPAPKPVSRGAHGNPGDRVVGETLVEVWPQALRRVLGAGRMIPTHYGPTLELHNLVSVIQSSWMTHRQFEGDDERMRRIFGFGNAELDDYLRRLMTAHMPEGADYSYGSRMSSSPWAPEPVVRSGGLVLYEDEVCDAGTCDRPPGHEGPHSQFDGPPAADAVPLHAPVGDQLAFLDQNLRERLFHRAHFVTPWRPLEDAVAGKSGQPCMVSVQFRVVPQDHALHQLHTTVVFRSHDLFAAYPLNLAAICRWAVQIAKRYHLDPESVTCLSVSGHVYERDWLDARKWARPSPKVIVLPALERDPRSTWHIERGSKDTGDPVNTYFLRATAMHPVTGEVIMVIEGPEPGPVALRIQQSGLVTTIGHALWIGRELERVRKQWGRNR